MNLQIFGSKKSPESRKAERYFKERGIKFQYIDMSQKEMSRGELQSIAAAVGTDALIDRETRDRESLLLITYSPEDLVLEKLYENQDMIKLPIVRNGRKATVGYAPDVWKTWD